MNNAHLFLSGQPSRQKQDGLFSSLYDVVTYHTRLLNDKRRTEYFIRAIRNVVEPGDVVCDNGTGTGILALAAAQAGAQRVYAIESHTIGGVAQCVFEEHGLAERVKLIRGVSNEVVLPERVDVLITEIIGTHALCEGILKYTVDAVERFLKPDACIIPRNIQIFVIPVEIPSNILSRYAVTQGNINQWKAWYDIDFSTFRESAYQAPHYFLYLPQDAKEWNTLSPPIQLADIDLFENRNITWYCKREQKINTSGALNGLLMFFNAQLDATISLSTNPRIVSQSNCWYVPVWLCNMFVAAGDRIEIVFRYLLDGIHNSVTVKKVLT